MNQIISLNFNGLIINFYGEAFINATEVAKMFGKRTENYLRNESTKAYIAALAENLSVTRKSVTEQNQLVTVIQGGKEQGTWFHPKLAIDFARWLSPEFAVWCDAQIESILSGKQIEAAPTYYVYPSDGVLKMFLSDHEWLVKAITDPYQGHLSEERLYTRLAVAKAIVGAVEFVLLNPVKLGEIHMRTGIDFNNLPDDVRDIF